jgi:hypothetical protein
MNRAFTPSLEPIQLDLCDLVERNEEHQLFDYKGPMAWNESSREAMELVKDALALANTGGGYLVIGVAEKPEGGFEFAGLSESQVASWDATRVGNKIRAHADPAVSLRTRVVECRGLRFVLVTVEGFQRVPHICKKSFETKEWGRILTAPTIYIRTATCESRPIQTADELSDLIERAVRTRHDEMLTAMRSAMIGASTTTAVTARAAFERQAAESLQEGSDTIPSEPYDGFYTDVMYPARFEEERFARSQLRDALTASSVIYEGAPLLVLTGWDDYITVLADGLRLEFASSSGKVPGNPLDRYYFWRIKQSGLLVVRSLAWEDTHFAPRGQRRINKASLVNHMSESVAALVRLYSELGVSDEDVTWMFNLAGTRHRFLADPPNIMPYPGQNPMTEEASISYRKTLSIEDWRAGLLDHVVDAVRDIVEQFKAPFVNYGDVREQARKHLRLSS